MRATLIHLVESYSARDKLLGFPEIDVLAALCKESGATCTTHYVDSVVDAEAALRDIMEGHRDGRWGSQKDAPILHVSSHGTLSGLELGDGELLPWSRFSHALGELGYFAEGLGLCLSTCRGLMAAKMAQQVDLPFDWLVCTADDVRPMQANRGFRRFYLALLAGKNYHDALVDLKGESGQDWLWVNLRDARTATKDGPHEA